MTLVHMGFYYLKISHKRSQYRCHEIYLLVTRTPSHEGEIVKLLAQ